MTRFVPAESPSPPDAGFPAPDPAPIVVSEPLPGGPESAPSPEKTRGRRKGKSPAGQGPAPQCAFPEAGFPLWARNFASQNSKGRIDASRRSEGREAEESIDRLSSNPRRLEGHPEKRRLARRASYVPVSQSRDEGRGAEEGLDRTLSGGRAMERYPEGRGFARWKSDEPELEPALEPVSQCCPNLPPPPTGRPFDGRSLRGLGHGNTGDRAAEKLGRADEGRGLDIRREEISTPGENAPPPEAFEAAFLAGAALAALDSVARAESPWRGAWSARLALSAASASSRLLGRGEDEAALRDAFALRRPGDDPGPAGRLLAAWRRAAGVRPERVFAQEIAEKIALDLGLPRSGPVLTAIEDAADLAEREKPAVFAAAEAAAQAYRALGQSHGREAEIFALLLADAVLACRLGWPLVVPLFATVIFDPALRRGPEGKRPRPDDPDWPRTCCLAYVRAAASAHDLAKDLARRGEKLEAAVPHLRTKGAEAAVGKILEDDVVAAPMRPGNLSERSARRLLDRLVALGALRELTGRPSFRLYGL